jgi:hypothetical protein
MDGADKLLLDEGVSYKLAKWLQYDRKGRAEGGSSRRGNADSGRWMKVSERECRTDIVGKRQAGRE